MTYHFERNLAAKDSRRMHAEDRYLGRLEVREYTAKALVGELNSGKCYINVRDRKGHLTGKTVEFAQEFEAISYLLRNKYV